MELENLFCKMLDIVFVHGKKYSNEKIAQELYYNVYSPTVNDLLPFMRNYNGDKNVKLAEVLCDCRTILSDNFAISNPTHIKRIDKIINSNKEFNKFIPYFNALVWIKSLMKIII